MSIANFLFVAAKKKLKIYENEEHGYAPKSVWVHMGKEIGVSSKEGLGVTSPRFLLSVPAWGLWLLADWTSPMEVCDSALANFHGLIRSHSVLVHISI